MNITQPDPQMKTDIEKTESAAGAGCPPSAGSRRALVEVSVTKALSHVEDGSIGTNPAWDFGCMVALADEVKRLREELMDAYKPESYGDHDL